MRQYINFNGCVIPLEARDSTYPERTTHIELQTAAARNTIRVKAQEPKKQHHIVVGGP